MAKRPPSRSTAEEDVISAADTFGPNIEPTENVEAESVAVEQAAPVTLEEPPHLEPDPTDSDSIAPDFSTPDRVEQQPSDVLAAEATEVGTPDAGPEAADPPQADAAEPEAVPPPQPALAPVEKRGGSGFLGTALGGVVAAAAGYALATFVPFPGIGTSDAPPTATQAEVQALTARVETLESTPGQDPALADRISVLEARPMPDAPAQQDLSPLTDALTALESRLAVIETRDPAQLGKAPSADLVALVDTLRAEVAEIQASSADANAGLQALTAQTEARLAEAEAQAAALRAEAEQTAGRAVSAAALGRVQAALESGAPFAGALVDIPDVEIPAALASLAETGVPSRAALQDAFPPAARVALEASLRADMGDGWSDRVASFLQSTTGARSLVPREGTDPDAVLSRAEAAVRSGDLAQALTELEGLPLEGQAVMADWTAMARQRLDAIAAASALSAAVEG